MDQQDSDDGKCIRPEMYKVQKGYTVHYLYLFVVVFLG